MSVERGNGPRLASARRPGGLAALLALALLAAFVSAIASGSYSIPLQELPAVLWRGVFPADGADGGTADLVVWQVRLPRVLAAALAGQGVALCPLAMIRGDIEAGRLVEMPFENLSNGAALWVDVVWSKERPLGLGAARFVALMRDQRALEAELA